MMGTDHILNEVGSRTRRRPMGQDYAAAKDAEVGNRKTENRRHITLTLRKFTIVDAMQVG